MTARATASGAGALRLFCCILTLWAEQQSALATELGSAEAEQARAALREALDNGSFQSELPFAPVDEPKSRRSLPLGSLGPIFSVFAWMLICAALVIIVVAIVLAIRGRSAASDDATLPGAGVTADGRVEHRGGGPTTDLLDRAEELAAAGNYQEAAHLMLLGAIERLSQTAALRSRSSQTSRELLDDFDAEPERRTAMRNLVSVVECSLFGGRSLNRKHLDDCRSCLRVLLHGEAA